MIRRLLLAIAARIGAALEVHEPPLTPEDYEAAREWMRQGAITDGVDYRVEHLPAAVILDDLAAWDAELQADHG